MNKSDTAKILWIAALIFMLLAVVAVFASLTGTFWTATPRIAFSCAFLAILLGLA